MNSEPEKFPKPKLKVRTEWQRMYLACYPSELTGRGIFRVILAYKLGKKYCDPATAYPHYQKLIQLTEHVEHERAIELADELLQGTRDYAKAILLAVTLEVS